MPQQSVNELTALLPLLIQLVGLVFAVLVDSYLDKRQKRVMLVVAALAIDSGNGNGTTVTITLPVTKEEEDNAGNLRR